MAYQSVWFFLAHFLYISIGFFTWFMVEPDLWTNDDKLTATSGTAVDGAAAVAMTSDVRLPCRMR